MEKNSIINIYSPFSNIPLVIEFPTLTNEHLIHAAAITENTGALWVLSAENLGDLDVSAMNTRLDLTKLSLSDHLKRTVTLSEDHFPKLKAHFSQCDFEQDEFGNAIHSANLQIRSLTPFLRDFYLSGIRQVICENHNEIYEASEDFKLVFCRLVELSIAHQKKAEKFDRLGEMSFMIASVFSAIRLYMLKKRLFPFSEEKTTRRKITEGMDTYTPKFDRMNFISSS